MTRSTRQYSRCCNTLCLQMLCQYTITWSWTTTQVVIYRHPSCMEWNGTLRKHETAVYVVITVLVSNVHKISITRYISTWWYPYCWNLASFPGSSPAFCRILSSPAFCRILYSMRQKAGEEPGNEASWNPHCWNLRAN